MFYRVRANGIDSVKDYFGVREHISCQSFLPTDTLPGKDPNTIFLRVLCRYLQLVEYPSTDGERNSFSFSSIS